MSICERLVQLAINKLASCTGRKGFKVNSRKHTFVVFSRKRDYHPVPHITPNGLSILVVNVDYDDLLFLAQGHHMANSAKIQS